VQATNDFMVFSVQALASLGSGWFLYRWQWQGILYACIPLALGFTGLLAWNRKNLIYINNR